MIPNRLEVRGFSCFRETVEVDLASLEVELFAIAGPTGAGKSTLLDAMTFALFGQTARLGGRGHEALMSPGVEETVVQFDFANGRGSFRVTRLIGRKGSRVGSQVRIHRLAADGSWRQLPESERIREANAKIEDLVGLDYEGFTRAVFLPQGAFDEFLRGDPGKRRRLLVSLLGLDRLETMQRLAGQLARTADAEREQLRSRLEEDYADVGPERLRQLRDARAEMLRKLEGLALRREELDRIVRELEEVQRLGEERDRLDLSLRALVEREPEIEELAARVERGRRAGLLAPQLNRLEALRERESGLAERESRLAARDAEARETLAALERERQEAEENLRQQRPGIDRQLREVAEVSPLLDQLRARGGTLEAAPDSEPAPPFEERSWDALQAALAQLPTLNRLRAGLARERSRLSRLDEAIERLAATVADTAAGLERLKAEGQEARARFREAESTWRAAERQDLAAALLAGLAEGDPCPVCGGTVTRVGQREGSDLAPVKAARDEAEARLEEVKVSWRRLEADLRSQQELLRERQQDRAEGRLRLEGAERECAELEGALAAAADGSGAAGPDLDLAARLEAWKRSLLAGLAAGILARTEGRDPDEVRRGLEQERERLEGRLRHAEVRLRETSTVSERLRAEREAARAASRQLAEDLGELQREFLEGLAASGFSEVPELRRAILAPSELERLEQDRAAYRQQREAAERRLVEVRSQLAGRTSAPAELEQRKLALGAAREETESLRTDLGRVERDLQDAEERLRRAQELRARLQEAEQRFDLYRGLQLDLRSDRFQDYLMTRLQQQLARRASAIVRTVSDGRYDLRLRDGEYHVRDAWNTGELRSARTLSGGESFVASLALALALSDTVAGDETLGALFLDEGFGTLDSETLDGVASVLESLTREGRIVGLITHVTALSERLPARLLVRKGPEGSTVHWDV